jgi:hypothetical protein
VTALRLRWPWLEWKNPDKIWVGRETHAARQIWLFSMRLPPSRWEMWPKPPFGVLLGFMVALPVVVLTTRMP